MKNTFIYVLHQIINYILRIILLDSNLVNFDEFRIFNAVGVLGGYNRLVTYPRI